MCVRPIAYGYGTALLPMGETNATMVSFGRGTNDLIDGPMYTRGQGSPSARSPVWRRRLLPLCHHELRLGLRLRLCSVGQSPIRALVYAMVPHSAYDAGPEPERGTRADIVAAPRPALDRCTRNGMPPLSTMFTVRPIFFGKLLFC